MTDLTTTVHRAGQGITSIFAGILIHEGASYTERQFLLMRQIDHTTDCSQTDLTQFTGIDRSTLADIIRRLIARGVVSRRRSKEDARAYRVRLTEKGKRVYDALAPKYDKRYAEMIAGLKPADLAAAARVHQHVASFASKAT